MSQAENDIKKLMEQSMQGISGLLNQVNIKLTEAKDKAQTDEQKKEFAEHFVKSGVLKEFHELTDKFKQL